MNFIKRHNHHFISIVVFLSLFLILSIIRVKDLPVLNGEYSINKVLINTFDTGFIILVTDTFNPYVLFLVSVILSSFLLFKRKFLSAALFFLVMGVSLASALFFKELFHITRPVGGIITETGWSFPSGHATGVATFFLMCIFWLRDLLKNKLCFAVFIIASLFIVLLTGFSRFYLGVHTIVDILAGFVLGTFWVLIGIVAFKYLKEKLNIENT